MEIDTDIDVMKASSTYVILHAMDLDTSVLNHDDMSRHRSQIDAWLAKWDIKIGVLAFPYDGANIVDSLAKASKLEGNRRKFYIFKAYKNAQTLYYGCWRSIKQHKTPMSEEVKMELAERRESKRLAEGKPSKVVKPAAVGRVPLYKDKTAQLEKEKIYPWIISGSWRQDPLKANSTILDIKCQDCGVAREIHAADAFQVKRCVTCKKKRPSKP